MASVMSNMNRFETGRQSVCSVGQITRGLSKETWKKMRVKSVTNEKGLHPGTMVCHRTCCRT